MTQTNATIDHSSLIPGAHRLIRSVDEKDGPFAGALVTYEDSVAVCVSADQLADWPGWAYSDAEHVCGVLDVRRRPDGQDALLPWCTCRVEAFLGRRQTADAPLHAGELGTLVVSVVRGVRELGEQDSEITGDWWLTGDGRPLFVHGEGGAARARTASLVERSAQHTSDRATIRILHDVVAALRRPRHHIEEEQRWEQELFAIAAPRALRLDVFAPERVGAVSAQRMTTHVPAAAEGRATRRQMRADTRTDRFHRLTALTRDRAEGLIARLPRRKDSATKAATAEQRGKPSRRRSILFAGSLGATVLIIGLMWPSNGTEDDAEASSGFSRVAESVHEETAQEAATSSEAAEGDGAEATTQEAAQEDVEVMAALPSVLGALQKCVDDGDATCSGAVTEGAGIPSEGLVIIGPDASSAVLVEDYGDVAVVRLTPAASAGVEQMLVLERQNELWLLRDVYDVAKQPE